MYSLVLAGLTLAGIVLRNIFPRALSFAWTTPDFLLLLVVYNAMFSQPLHSGVTGFMIGLVQDLAVGRLIGMNALAKCIVGLVCASFSKAVFKENVWIPVLNVFIGTVLNQCVILSSGYLTGLRWNLQGALFQGAFELVFNICLVPLTYGFYFKFSGKYLVSDEETE